MCSRYQLRHLSVSDQASTQQCVLDYSHNRSQLAALLQLIGSLASDSCSCSLLGFHLLIDEFSDLDWLVVSASFLCVTSIRYQSRSVISVYIHGSSLCVFDAETGRGCRVWGQWHLCIGSLEGQQPINLQWLPLHCRWLMSSRIRNQELNCEGWVCMFWSTGVRTPLFGVSC